MALQRPPKSAAEIAAMPDLSGPEFDEFLAARGPELSAETLVYLLRELDALGDIRQFRRCGEFLLGVVAEDGSIRGGHCEGIIRALARHYGFKEAETLREYRAACYEVLWRDIRAGRLKSKHLEERFGRAFKARAIDVARSLARQQAVDKQLIELTDDITEGEASTATKEALDVEVLGKLEYELLLSCLRALPVKEAHAAQLVWLEGWPIESSDASELTAARAMGMSGRMVRKYLNSAKLRLRGNPQLKAIIEDLG